MLLDIIFPKSCLGCGKQGRYICEVCFKEFTNTFSVCPECLRFSKNGKTHKNCTKIEGLNGLYSMWCYRGIVRKILLSLKYKYAFDLADEICEKACISLKNTYPTKLKNITLVPIPMFWKKKNLRGFNQAEIIGKRLAKNLNWDYSDKLLQKVKDTHSQSLLKRTERMKNIKDVFRVDERVLGKISKTNIILFDDIYTTGSTLKEACRILKNKGIKKVWGITLAR